MSKLRDYKVITTVDNDDYFKVLKILDSYKGSGTKLEMTEKENGEVEIGIKTIKGCIKPMLHDFAVLRTVGIWVKLEAE